MLSTKNSGLALFALIGLLSAHADAGPQKKMVNPWLHDPSSLVDGGNGQYYVFGTGGWGTKNWPGEPGLRVFTSTDLHHWLRLLPNALASAAQPLWAPEVVPAAGGGWWLYYSVSSWGSQNSCVRLAWSPSLASSITWMERGDVVCSSGAEARAICFVTIHSRPAVPFQSHPIFAPFPSSGLTRRLHNATHRTTRTSRPIPALVVSQGYNAIDPAVVRTIEGEMWLLFGSAWQGVQMARLDSSSGKLSHNASALRRTVERNAWGLLNTTATTRPPVVTLARPPPPDAQRSKSNGADVMVEAAYITRHQSYYYLFVNWGWCCQGPRSSYTVRVGRSSAVEVKCRTAPHYTAPCPHLPIPTAPSPTTSRARISTRWESDSAWAAAPCSSRIGAVSGAAG